MSEAVRVHPHRVSSPVVATLATAVVLAGAWLAAPPMGTDLSAQVARAEFFAAHGWAVIDFRWYGGVSPYGYSLLSPPLMAWFGPRPIGAAAAVISAGALAVLLWRTGARRPLLGGVLGAVAFTGNLVSGRVTFALGVALALLALLALTTTPGRPAAPADLGVIQPDSSKSGLDNSQIGGAWAIGGAAVLAVLAAATSPVAGLFLGLAGAALLTSAWLGKEGSSTRKCRTFQDARSLPAQPSAGSLAGAGVALMVGAAVPMAVLAGGFGAGGWMNISRSDTLHAVVTSLAVAVLVSHRVVRVGALFSAAGVAAAYLLTTPVGLNATRLATMFALPVVAAYAFPRSSRPQDRRGWGTAVWLVPVLVGLALWQPPVMVADLARAGDPTTAPELFAPLRQELAGQPLPGRVEVVPTRHYWEVAHLGEVPLARGWLRQADLGRNPLFFDGTLDAGSYRDWLAGNAVSYVALTREPLSWVGDPEAELIRSGLPYLTLVWENEHWQLYEVDGATGIVEGPARLREQTGAAVVFEADRPGEVRLRLHWSRWLAVSGPGEPCLAPAGEWTTVRVDEPGRYRVTGALLGTGPHC